MMVDAKGGRGRGKWKVSPNGYEVSFGAIEGGLELHSGNRGVMLQMS